MLTAGIIAAAGLLFLVFKLGIRRVISYDLAFDIAITAVLMVSLAGTFSGMMAALLGGLIVSVTLYIMKRTMVREQLAVVKEPVTVHNKQIQVPKIKWVTVYPDGTKVL